MKISVVIPVYNKEKYMDDLFQCLLSQTFEEFECILIDDGSTDASGEICDKVACIDKRFEVIHIPNSGVSHARNVGIDASCGESGRRCNRSGAPIPGYHRKRPVSSHWRHLRLLPAGQIPGNGGS